MRAARFYGPGDIRVEDIPEPVPKEGQVKVKVATLFWKKLNSLQVLFHVKIAWYVHEDLYYLCLWTQTWELKWVAAWFDSFQRLQLSQYAAATFTLIKLQYPYMQHRNPTMSQEKRPQLPSVMSEVLSYLSKKLKHQSPDFPEQLLSLVQELTQKDGLSVRTSWCESAIWFEIWGSELPGTREPILSCRKEDCFPCSEGHHNICPHFAFIVSIF